MPAICVPGDTSSLSRRAADADARRAARAEAGVRIRAHSMRCMLQIAFAAFAASAVRCDAASRPARVHTDPCTRPL
ncbi:hypothetical protein WS62_14775 [Burkholderia sp. ABCPW 14]|nr:hypothetical protein WS62_14775 [Burkholderia sp. ABCPW 14]